MDFTPFAVLYCKENPSLSEGLKAFRCGQKKLPYGKIKATDNRKIKTIGGSPQNE